MTQITIIENLNVLKPEKIELRKPLITDVLKAERLASKNEEIKFALAILSQVATFDGKKLTIEQLGNLDPTVLTDLTGELGKSTEG